MDHIPLSPERAVALATIYQTPAYEAMLDLLQAICEVRETKHFRLGPDKTNSEVRNSLAECRAARAVLELFEQEVRYNMGLLQPEESVPVLTDEQLAGAL